MPIHSLTFPNLSPLNKGIDGKSSLNKEAHYGGALLFDILSYKIMHTKGLPVPINPLFSERKKLNLAHLHASSFLFPNAFITRWALCCSPLHDGLYL